MNADAGATDGATTPISQPPQNSHQRSSALLTLKIPANCEDFCQAASLVSCCVLALRAAIKAVTMVRPALVR